jgi:cytochrome P450
MRLKPVAPLNIQEAARDTVIGGVAMPRGTLVICLMRPAAVDERHFADAQAFRPERWLEGPSPSSSKRVAMPFGAGPRICPGRYLALAEMKMVIAMLLGAFEIESVTAPDGADARERLALTMSPVDLRLRLRRLAA